MHRVIAVTVVVLALVACGSDGAGSSGLPATDGGATGTCLAGDPDCEDTGAGDGAEPLPEVVNLSDPDDPDAPLQLGFGGFFFSDGTTSQLCSALTADVPPSCTAVSVELVAPLESVLEHVSESFGNPEDAKINTSDGFYWTDDWVNVSGTLLDVNRLALD